MHALPTRWQYTFERLRATVDTADDRQRDLLQRGVRLGVVVDEYRERFDAGDFLVRNVIGVDEARGAVLVSDRIEVGQTVQFQVRDASAAAADLRRRLEGVGPSAGGLLFTCNGRGREFFGMKLTRTIGKRPEWIITHGPGTGTKAILVGDVPAQPFEQQPITKIQLPSYVWPYWGSRNDAFEYFGLNG